MWVLEIQTRDFYLLTLLSGALLILLLGPHSQTWPWCANVTWGSPGPILQGPGLLEKIPRDKPTQVNRSSHFYSMLSAPDVQHWPVWTEHMAVSEGCFYLHFRGKGTKTYRGQTGVKSMSPASAPRALLASMLAYHGLL